MTRPGIVRRIALVGLGPQHSQRPRLEVGPAAEGVDQVTALARPRHGVDGEVAASQVLLDRVALESGEVEHPAAAAVDHPPGPEGLREPEDRPPDLSSGLPGRALGVTRNGEVQVAHRPSEELVPQGSADDPGAAHRTCSRRTRAERPQVIS